MVAVRRGALCQEKCDYKGSEWKLTQSFELTPAFTPSPKACVSVSGLQACTSGGPPALAARSFP